MPKEKTRGLCNCDDPHKPNAVQGQQKKPVALWHCPIHGNVFSDAFPEIQLTATQREILEFIKREHDNGHSAGLEDISDHFGYSRSSVRVQMNVLQSLNLIERI